MSFKLILFIIALFVCLPTSSLKDTTINTDIIAVYISVSSQIEFNLTWIDDVITRVEPIQHVYNVTHLVLTLHDCETLRARIITNNKCISTTLHDVPFNCEINKQIDEYLLLNIALDMLYNDKIYSHILSVLDLTLPKYSVLTVLPEKELILSENQTESILNRIYENIPLSFNTLIFVINESIHPHYKLYGSPGYEDTYTDGTGFNEALTANNIPVSERYISLQYNMLTNGIYTRVASYQKFDNSQDYLFKLLIHLFTNYFVSNDEYLEFKEEYSDNCIDTLLCTDYIRSQCEDDILNKFTVKQLEKVIWERETSLNDYLFENNELIVLTNTSVLEWSALETFTFENLPNIFTQEEYHDVKHTSSKLTFDPDLSVDKLKFNISLSYQKISLTRDELSHSFTHSSNAHYLFTKLSPSLLPYFSPREMLFQTYDDYLSGHQFLWISSSGLATHLHIDMDWNCFVQIRGRKRFTLFPPSQHELMYMYPRIHPMWHKSRIDLDHFSDMFSNFLLTSPVQVTLEPGDLLFIPGYTWHYVESLTPSISLSTWSHDYQLRAHMDAVYKYDHKFDLLHHKQGRIAALRLYIDMLINKMVGVGRTKQFLGRLISNRFHGLETLFTHELTSTLCDPYIIPTALHVIGYARLDTDIISQHFTELSPAARDILLVNYIEEISAGVVGTRYLYAFFTQCFASQTYHRTDMYRDIDIWKHVDN
ncbi:hypothetical protein LOD99_16223 [Oopsacas minuta]|uniref:JmjC domain-containing protein n=1 Tax=Oopsacas minuta TaxID=111878 RepID=A0AAV7K9F3_9METZ|nr:hypothetical protein LOD99_16223 [Oopsacas minuta]